MTGVAIARRRSSLPGREPCRRPPAWRAPSKGEVDGARRGAQGPEVVLVDGQIEDRDPGIDGNGRVSPAGKRGDDEISQGVAAVLRID